MKKYNEVYKYEISAETRINSGAVQQLDQILKENEVTAKLRKFLIFVDKNLYLRQKNDVDNVVSGISTKCELEIIDSGELIKTMAGAEMIYQILSKHAVKRDCGIIAIGGGTICDVLGFVCATYMRGLVMVSVPTTMMSCSDPVVGKVGVNYLMHKNLIGAWFTPAITVIDVDFLKKDSPRHISTGVAEIIKAAFIDSREKVVELASEMSELLSLDKPTLEKYIGMSLDVKIRAVKGDEKDQSGPHAKLSLGHTLADVIETISPFGFVTHGEAVGLGMIFAARVNEIMTHDDLSSQILKETVNLVELANLPTKLPIALNDEELVSGLLNNKKSRGDSITLLLVKNYGNVVRVEGILPEVATEALSYIK